MLSKKEIFDLIASRLTVNNTNKCYKLDDNLLQRYILLNGKLELITLNSQLKSNSNDPIVLALFGLDEPPLKQKYIDKINNEKFTKYSTAKTTGCASPFEGLVHIIFGQQVSQAVASKMKSLFLEKFGSDHCDSNNQCFRIFPEPSEFLNSYEKIENYDNGFNKKRFQYIINIAIFLEKINTFAQVKAIPDYREQLLNIKGIGNWSLNWFELSAMRNFDTLAITDLIVKRSLIDILKLDNPTNDELTASLAKEFPTQLGTISTKMLLSYKN